MSGQGNKSSVLQMCVGKAQNLQNLVEYSTDSIVSKTILDKQEGTITLFAFDKDQGLSEHTTPFDAMVYVVEGDLEIIISGNPYNLTANQMIIMPAQEPHALKAISRVKMLLIMIRSE